MQDEKTKNWKEEDLCEIDKNLKLANTKSV